MQQNLVSNIDIAYDRTLGYEYLCFENLQALNTERNFLLSHECKLVCIYAHQGVCFQIWWCLVMGNKVNTNASQNKHQNARTVTKYCF